LREGLGDVTCHSNSSPPAAAALSTDTYNDREREKGSAGVRVDTRAQKILAVSVVVLPKGRGEVKETTKHPPCTHSERHRHGVPEALVVLVVWAVPCCGRVCVKRQAPAQD